MEAAIQHTSDTFSFNRFREYFTFYVTSNKRKLILGSTLVLIITFFFFLFILYNGGIDRYDYDYRENTFSGYDPFWSYGHGTTLMLAFIFMALAGAMMYGAMARKKERLNTLSLPASQAEKFLTWWVIYVPLALAVILCSFWIVEVLRVVWMNLFTPYGDLAKIMPLKNLWSFTYPSLVEYTSETPGKVAFIVYSLLIFCSSLFALGSILFHKISFIKTVIAIFVLGVVYSLALIIGKSAFLVEGYGMAEERFDMGFSNDSYLLFGIFILIGIGLYFLSYVRFREDEIINRW